MAQIAYRHALPISGGVLHRNTEQVIILALPCSTPINILPSL
jgi:hypothetical protein